MGAIGAAVGGVIGGVGGAITGFQGKKSSSNNLSGINLNDASQDETSAFAEQNNSFSAIQHYLNNNGPNEGDYAAGNQAIKNLATTYGEYAQSGGLPTDKDISTSNDLAKSLFGARQVALNQSFTDQNTAAQRLSAQLGRPIDDPILQSKLRTGFMRQQDQLSAEQQAQATQLSLALPQQRLGYMQQMTNTLSSYGNQALANRQYLMGLGSQIGNQERTFREQTSDRFSNTSNKQGGGIGDMLTGAIGGAGAGIGAGASAGLALGGGMSSLFSAAPSGSVGSPSASNYSLGSYSSSFGGGQAPAPAYGGLLGSSNPFASQTFSAAPKYGF